MSIDELPGKPAAPDEREPVRFGRGADAFVLLIVAQGRSYGYEIRKRLQEFGYVKTASEPGVLYRLLRDLEANGAIASEWDIAGSGPARRYYTITPTGRDQLRQGAEKLRTFKLNIERFLTAFAELDLDDAGHARDLAEAAAGAIR